MPTLVTALQLLSLSLLVCVSQCLCKQPIVHELTNQNYKSFFSSNPHVIVLSYSSCSSHYDLFDLMSRLTTQPPHQIIERHCLSFPNFGKLEHTYTHGTSQVRSFVLSLQTGTKVINGGLSLYRSYIGACKLHRSS